MARTLLTWPAYTVGLWFVTFLEWIVHKIVPPEEYVLRKATSLIDQQVILMCCELNLSEAIGASTVAVDQLAEKKGRCIRFSVSPHRLYMMLT